MTQQYYTMRDVAEAVGVPYYTFYYLVKRSRQLPSPSHTVGNLNKLYYDDADLEGFRRLFAKYREENGSDNTNRKQTDF